MAIFGDLKHHAFIDVIKILKPQVGELYLREAYQGKNVEISLSQGQVRGMYLDGFPVSDYQKMINIIADLMQHNQGSFEFHSNPSLEHPGGGTAFFLDDIIAEVSRRANITDDQLPHPDTRFAIAPKQPGGQLPTELQKIWLDVQSMLVHQQAVSAREVASRLGRDVRDIQVALFQLRSVGRLTPQRAMAAQGNRAAPNGSSVAPQASMPAPHEPAQSAPVLNRLLGALRRLTGGSRT